MRILYVCNDHAYFEAHRRWLADEAVRRGHQVFVACGAVNPTLGETGPVDVVLDVVRHNLNLRSDLRTALAIARAARELKADVVHLITIKPVLLGTIALRLQRQPRRVVATFPGLGRIFDYGETGFRARLRRALVIIGLRFGLRASGSVAICETGADKTLLEQLRVVDPARTIHIAGAGVDPSVYRHAALPGGSLRLLFAGRLLRAKGVNVVVEAARLVASEGHDITFLVAGGAQDDPGALDADELGQLKTGSPVVFLGEIAPVDMPACLASAHAVVLPTTYQEGVPRILIEAGAVGRPAIVSDNPGCKAFVTHEVSGLVMDAVTARCLADCAIRLATEPELLRHLGEGASKRVVAGGFRVADVGERTLALYPAPP